MMLPHRPLLGALALALAGVGASAQELPPPKQTTGTWNGMNVTLSTPGYKVWQFDPFSISLEFDSSSLGAEADFPAFMTTIGFSDTVTFTQASTWSYRFESDDGLLDGYTASGTLGDWLTPISGNYEIRLKDALWWSDYTWLDPEYHDKVVWTFDNIFIDGDTNVSVTVADAGITGTAALQRTALVIDPPRPVEIATPVPEPDSIAMMLAGLGLIGAMGWRSRARRKAA